jgi:nucleoid DNA-binding protein
MVNEVNKLIYIALAEHNAVTLPRVGSLLVVRREAKMEGGRVVSPTFAVEFKSAEDGVSLCDIIASVANISATEAEDIYLRWLDKVREGNTLTISGVGTLRDKSFIVDTALAQVLNLAKSTPLKIHSRSRKPYLLIAAVVAILLGIGAYLFVANDRVATPVVEEPVIVAVAESPEPIVEEVIEEVVTPEPEPKRWVDNDDIRHWVVVGSYSTRENAERAVEDILSKQQAECCDILTLGKMFAVAVYGSVDKAECESFVRDNRHEFKQSWVHTPKRFK